MIVVTGGAGFIGSCLVARLNATGRQDLIVVDHLEESDAKNRNLAGKRYARYADKKAFLDDVLAERVDGPVETVIHMGACSSTTGTDQKYYETNNFEYTKHLASWCVKRNARLIYASSAATYGNGAEGYSDDDATTRRLKPLNFYGESKHKFDLWALDHGLAARTAGLKFFNVFGPNEYHKGDMRSVVAKAYAKVAGEGTMSLFKSYHKDYRDGEQKRDFIYVKDAVDVVMFFVNNPHVNGIYNVGTGEARTWNDLALALFAAVGKKPQIEYVDMPEHLRPRYQYFTEAQMSKLRNAGYRKPFMSLEDAVKDDVEYLKAGGTL